MAIFTPIGVGVPTGMSESLGTTDFEAIRRAMQAAEVTALEAARRLRVLRARLQLACPHKLQIEAPYGQLLDHGRPPFRVCEDCGFAEEGWSCGYQILGGRVFCEAAL